MAQPDNTGEKQVETLFKPGQSGNPRGRPRGSRNKLGEAFIDALHADFEVNGEAVIIKVREDRPQDYLKVVASLLPKEYHVKETTFDDMTDEQLSEVIDAIRSARIGIGRKPTPSGDQTAGVQTEPDSVH